MLITLQYLEDSPELLSLSKNEVIEKLKYAFDKLPVTHLLIGWHVPDPLLEACKKECEKNGTKFIRWQPLLTGDGVISPRESWQVTSVLGKKIPGFQNMPEFTFICPNCAEASGRINEHIVHLTDLGLYDGLFLDRIRYPSPASNPVEKLGCFCSSCKEKALKIGFDLEEFQTVLQRSTASIQGKLELIHGLFGREMEDKKDSIRGRFAKWMDFREESITDFVNHISNLLVKKGLDVGLDCFSPSLTRMVGQNLTKIGQYANWIKVMSYAHTHGPAGLPFEIIDLFNYLIECTNKNEEEIGTLLSELLDLPLPNGIQLLRENGLSPQALQKEIQKGKTLASIPVLAGLELVEIPGVATLSDKQILLDHNAVLGTGVDGLSISWDLHHIPNHRLDLISSIWLK